MAQFKTKDKVKNIIPNNWTAKLYYTDWNGIKKQKKKSGFRTKGEAKEFEKIFIDKVNANNDMLFSNLVKHYYEFIESRLKLTTIENKKTLIDLKILPYFGDMPLNDIEPATVMKWQNELISKGYAPTYLKSIHNQLSAIFNFAMKFYKHNSNPARVCGSMGKKDADSFDFYTLEEFEKFIAGFENEPTVLLMLEILFWTGIRIGELFALTPSDLNFITFSMTIDENFQRHKGQDLIQIPKTYSSYRRITLPESLSDKIHEYIKRLHDIKDNEFIFTASKSYLHTKMTKGAKMANIKRISVHSLRHSHASHLIELGFSPLIIKERIGHKDIKTTLQTYAHLYPNKDVEVADKLNDLYKK